jgi:hypothetical protein
VKKLGNYPENLIANFLSNGNPLPLFTIRTKAEAKSKPIVVVFEPYQADKENLATVLVVENGIIMLE